MYTPLRFGFEITPEIVMRVGQTPFRPAVTRLVVVAAFRDRLQRSKPAVPGRYRKRVTKQNVVIAILLAQRETGYAIGRRRVRSAGTEIGRPYLREFHAAIPCDDAGLRRRIGAGELAEHRSAVGARVRAFQDCVSGFQMEVNSLSGIGFTVLRNACVTIASGSLPWASGEG